MCAICGIVAPGGARQIDVETMANVLSHRGPDDVGYFVKGAVGLGHRRLSIIDLNTGHQPVSNEDGTIWVVLNGEIYNYRELREQLHQAGHRFSTQTDTEVIVHLYEEYGLDCVKYLRGMFAFAVWDDRRQRLYAARDRLGQKPFFYSQRDSRFLFSSEIKGLLAQDPSLAEMDPGSLDQYLTLRIIAPPKTMFRSIYKLPPAHYLTYDVTSGLQIDRYWDLNYEPKLEGSDEELTDELEARLIECIKLHTVSDVPVGAFLSGGLDSTLVVALLMKQRPSNPIKTFSMGLPFGKYDEAPYAKMVADQYGTDHHEQTMVPSLLTLLPTLVWHLDEPSDPLSICSYLIAQMARKEVKVVLGGDGGDELFGGYDRYYGNRYASYYALLPQFVRQYGIGSLLRLIPDGNWYKSPGHQAKWLHRLSFLNGGDRYAHSLGYFYFGDEFRQELYGSRMQEEQGTFHPRNSICEAFDRASATDLVDKMLYADSQIRLPDHPVMILDRMTMAHGLEARSPFMDHEIAEFAAKLPARLKVRGRSLRYIQMRLAERHLPKELLNRPKQGFTSALPYLLKDEYQVLFQIFLKQSHLVRDGYFSQLPIDRLVGEYVNGLADHGNRLWLLLNSEVWYRMYIEGMSVEKLSAEIAYGLDEKSERKIAEAGQFTT